MRAFEHSTTVRIRASYLCYDDFHRNKIRRLKNACVSNLMGVKSWPAFYKDIVTNKVMMKFINCCCKIFVLSSDKTEIYGDKYCDSCIRV